jgi:molecular chaperone Hsp33
MGALLKGDQRVALKFEGNGPLGKILVEARSDGAVCGYVGDPNADLPPRGGRFDVAGLLGRAGLLTVTKDLRLKEPYTGTVVLRTSEIGEDLAFYLAESEQVPSAVGLGVRLGNDMEVRAAGGFLIQAMPPSDEGEVEAVTERIATLAPLDGLLRDGRPPGDVLADILQAPVDLLEDHPLAFQCGCSRERVSRALTSLGREGIASLIEEEEGVDVRCEFCGDSFRFEREDLERLISEVH